VSSDLLNRNDEDRRLRALDALNILDTPEEERFDLIVRLAQRLFSMPSVAISFVGKDRQWLKSRVGTGYREGPRAEAFCNYTIEQAGPTVVPDTLDDRRFSDRPSVTGPQGTRFYAGEPLESPGGYRVGTLCMWDTKPRDLSEADLGLLNDLARWVERELAADAELHRAGSVQRALLPKRAPSVPGYDIAGLCAPAREVGGDFFDYYLIGDQLQITIADVMGKGVGAALVAASVRAVLRGASRFNEVGVAVNRSARALESDLAETATFVTMFTARLEPSTGDLTYVDAGHGLSAIVRRSGSVQQLASLAPPIGVLPDSAWQEQGATLGPGDTFITLSDGWLDYFDSVPRAAAVAVRIVMESSSAQSIVDQIGGFSTCVTPDDDLTVIAVRRDFP